MDSSDTDTQRYRSSPLADKKVLIVSADHPELAQLRAHLLSWDLRVQQAPNPLDGLVQLRMAQDSPHPFDLVLFATRGHRVRGEQFAALLQSEPRLARLRSIHIGELRGTDREAALRQCGFSAFVPIPVDKTLLFNALHQAFSEVSPSSGIARLLDRYLALAPYTPPMDVLLAEPDSAQRRRVREALKRGGHHLFEVENGEQAMEALSTHVFDMVLIDLHLPGINAIEAVRLFHFSRAPDEWPPFVVLADQPSAEELRECRRLEIAALVHKPIQPQALAQTIATAARDGPGRPAESYGRRLAHASESALPIIDEHQLQELARLGEDPAFVSNLIGEFLAEIEQSLRRALDARGSAKAYARFLELGHALKDIAGNVGALRLYELALVASQLPEPIFEQEGERLLSRIELALDQTRAAFSRHLDHRGVLGDPKGSP